MEKITGTSDEILDPLSGYRSYSISEIFAAGGPTAFAIKMGKNSKNTVEKLQKLPEDAFLPNEEAAEALEMLRASK